MARLGHFHSILGLFPEKKFISDPKYTTRGPEK